MNKTTLMEVGYSRSKALVKATAVAALLLANPVAAMASDGAAGKLNVQSVQQGSLKVSGVVKDVDGEPIIGASIFEKGTKNGTVTDVNGKFSLDVKPGASLIVSYVGYTTQEVSATRNPNIILHEDDHNLNEVVVIGYGTQKKADVTSAVASVKSEAFNKGAILDAGQLVQGKVAGLQISLANGDPTGSTSVMLRGASTLMGSRDPLILVDGVPGSFSTVAPEEIESIDVLKDGSATAIYGTRGTNGVIIITTKSGRREQPTTIEYSGYVSVSKQLKRPDFMGADDLRARWKEGLEFSGANDQDYGATTNWLDEVSRTGVSNVHNVTLRGGGKSTSMLGNVTYEQRQGTLKKSDMKNIRARLELTHRMFNDKLTTNLQLIANERKNNAGIGFGYNVYRMACIQNPTQPVYDDEGNYVERNVYFYDNPITPLNEHTGTNRNRNIRFTGSLEFRPISDLIIKGMLTRKGQSNDRGYYYSHKAVTTTESGYNGYAYNYSYDLINDLYEITADWHHTFDKHNVGVIVGYNYEKTRYEWFDESNRNFPTDSYTYHKIETGKGLQNGAATMSSYKQEDTLIGLFGRVTYNYDDRYLLMASLRREGSSKFGADHKWGTFPGVSAGWRINNEKFMKGVKWVDNLKLRVGYGVTGININDPYQSLASLNYTNYFLYDGQWISTLVPARNANPDLRWEKKIEYNLGIDFELLKGRLGGAIDLYQRDTKDGLWNYTVPVPPYQYSTIMANVAKIRNSGIEILVNFVPVRTKDFEWRGNISYSHNKNEVRSISNDQFTMSTDYFYTGHTGEPIQTSTHRVKVGEPLGQFFGLKSVGLDESGKWVVERLKHDDPNDPEKVTGTYYGLAEDANDADKQVLGNGIAKHFLNFNNTLTYKGFDLSINMRGQFGFQILNFQEMYYANPTIQYNVLNSAFDMHPVVSVSEDGSSISYTGKQTRIADAQRYVSEYVENGSFWKIDNLTLGYTFNTSKWKIVRNLRVYASCLNLLTITSYKGLDPEMSFRGDETGGYALAFGTDHRDKFPTIRSYTFGINVTF